MESVGYLYDDLFYNDEFSEAAIRFLKETAYFSKDDVYSYFSNLFKEQGEEVISRACNIIWKSNKNIELIDKDLWHSKIVRPENDNIEKEIIILD